MRGRGRRGRDRRAGGEDGRRQRAQITTRRRSNTRCQLCANSDDSCRYPRGLVLASGTLSRSPLVGEVFPDCAESRRLAIKNGVSLGNIATLELFGPPVEPVPRPLSRRLAWFARRTPVDAALGIIAGVSGRCGGSRRRLSPVRCRAVAAPVRGTEVARAIGAVVKIPRRTGQDLPTATSTGHATLLHLPSPALARSLVRRAVATRAGPAHQGG